MKKLNIYKTLLQEREIIKIKGKDSIEFLQSIITNDIYLLTNKKAIYSALLSPQGKFLFDFLIFMRGDNRQEVLLDCEKNRTTELIKILNIYKLRKNINISKVYSAKVYVLFGKLNSSFFSKINLKNSAGYSISDKNDVMFIDPRNKNLGIRIIHFSRNLPKAIKTVESVSFLEWDLHRIKLGIPDGSTDIDINKSFLMENNFEFINGIDFSKGCYLGQENTVRQKFRATLKKRLMKVKIYGNDIPNGTNITRNNKIIGKMRSSRKNFGLATIKIDEAKDARHKKTKFLAANSCVQVIENF